MKQCANCGHENPDDQTNCVKCGLSLRVEPLGTRKLEPLEESARPRWGTARLGAERKLLLHIRDNAQPIIVHLKDEMVLGRQDTESGTAPDIKLDDYGAVEGGVSRRHALLFLEEDAIKIKDLGSANSTYLNGQRLIAHQARILRDGDELRLGMLVMRINFA